MKRERTEDDRRLISRLRSILNGTASPDTRIGQALDVLNQEAESGPAPERPSETFTSTPSRTVAGSAPPSPIFSRNKKHTPVLIGNSPAMRAVHAAIQRISLTSATVLLRGESGTGKELAAQRIHLSGARAGQPFVAVHCAAIPETLMESTLFGHERGAFTGASQARKGRLEEAHGGTLFLDEMGDISPATQVKLLRVLQEKEFERVGGGPTLSVDVRVIAATHRHLEAMVRAGEFREDLYYRLNVVPLTLPPLRDRPDDVPLLMAHFLDKVNRDHDRQIHLGKDLIQVMKAYHWPGNVRELQNCIERLVVLSETPTIELRTIPESLVPYVEHMRAVRAQSATRSSSTSSHQTLPARLDEIERDRLREALTRAGWVKAKAARLLGMTPRQIAYRMEKYRLADER